MIYQIMATRYEDYSGSYDRRLSVGEGQRMYRNAGYAGFLDEIVYMAGHAPQPAVRELESRFRTVSLLEAIAIGSAAEAPSRKQRLEEMAGVIGGIAGVDTMYAPWKHYFEGHRDLMVRAAEGGLEADVTTADMTRALHTMRHASARKRGYAGVCATAASGIRDHYSQVRAHGLGLELINMQHALEQACDGPAALFSSEPDVAGRLDGIGEVMFAVRLAVDERP